LDILDDYKERKGKNSNNITEGKLVKNGGIFDTTRLLTVAEENKAGFLLTIVLFSGGYKAGRWGRGHAERDGLLRRALTSEAYTSARSLAVGFKVAHTDCERADPSSRSTLHFPDETRPHPALTFGTGTSNTAEGYISISTPFQCRKRAGRFAHTTDQIFELRLTFWPSGKMTKAWAKYRQSSFSWRT